MQNRFENNYIKTDCWNFKQYYDYCFIGWLALFFVVVVAIAVGLWIISPTALYNLIKFNRPITSTLPTGMKLTNAHVHESYGTYLCLCLCVCVCVCVCMHACMCMRTCEYT